jgi:hypothetical protein
VWQTKDLQTLTGDFLRAHRASPCIYGDLKDLLKIRRVSPCMVKSWCLQNDFWQPEPMEMTGRGREWKRSFRGPSKTGGQTAEVHTAQIVQSVSRESRARLGQRRQSPVFAVSRSFAPPLEITRRDSHIPTGTNPKNHERTLNINRDQRPAMSANGPRSALSNVTSRHSFL